MNEDLSLIDFDYVKMIHVSSDKHNKGYFIKRKTNGNVIKG